jgi:hypothetical protein
MNTKDIIKNIPNKEGAAFFSVYLPSMDKDLRIKHLSINEQKIISKLSISEDTNIFASEADLAKIAVVEVNSLEPIELYGMDLRDFFILCCALRKENYINPLSIDYTCPKCQESFDESIDFDLLIENATEFEKEIKTTSLKTSAGEAQIHIGIPNHVDLVMLEMYYDRVGKTRDVVPTEKYIDYVICCIKKIEFKNEDAWEEVEDFTEMAYLDKVGFMEEIGADIEEIAKSFGDVGMLTSEFFYPIKCPNCKNELSTFVDTSDFFVL